MCSSGEAPEAYWESAPKARKEHICCECLSVIPPGDHYQLFEGVWEGTFARYHTCTVCRDVREAAQRDLMHDEGIAFGCLWETAGVEFEDVV